MFWSFKAKRPVVKICDREEIFTPIPVGFIATQSAQELLNTPRRQMLLTYIWQRTSISRQQFDLLYMKPIERYAALVQQFPASESHHHAYPGGMLDHGLEIMAYALKLRQSYLLPIGSSPEKQSAQAEVWSAGIAYAALLHDIGKIAVDLLVEDEDGQIWHPWQGTLKKAYHFKYHKKREYKLHSAASGLLYNQLLDKEILNWLSQTPSMFHLLIYMLSGQVEHAGIIGEIVTKADQASVAQELGGNPEKVMNAPKNAIQRKLLDGLRYLTKQELKLNNTGASDGWLTDNALWLVSKTVSDKLRAYLLSQGISGIPTKNSAIFDIMQEHNLLLPNAENKAIWSATVTSAQSGWSNSFTFMKITPSLIWDTPDRPEPFNGTVIVNTENNNTVSVQTDNTERNEKALQNPQVNENHSSADTLDMVLDLLSMDKMAISDNRKEKANKTIPEADDNTEVIDTAVSTQAHITSEEKPITKTINHKKSQKVIKPTKVTELITPHSQEEVKQSSLDEKKNLAITSVAQNENTSTNEVGEGFLNWLKESVLNQKLMINEPLALIHTVEDTIYLVTPGIFMRYVDEYPQIQLTSKKENIPAWHFVQRKFEKLKIHKKQKTGINIWTCTITGHKQTNKKIHGYLLAEPCIILPEVLFNNPYLKID